MRGPWKKGGSLRRSRITQLPKKTPEIIFIAFMNKTMLSKCWYNHNIGYYAAIGKPQNGAY